MTILLLLIPISLALLGVAVWAFVWAVRRGQFDDLDSAALDILADDIVRLCDVLGIDKPIVLGQSFGGFVAQRYLARHPAHALRVVLSSTSPHLGLARKLAMFERLGGEPAAAVGCMVRPGRAWAAAPLPAGTPR